MACEVVVTRTAEQDLDDILAFLVDVSDDGAAARSFLDRWSETVEGLATYPELFSVSHLPELARIGYRSFMTGRYVTLYRFDGERVYVVHVFHGSRNYARLLVPDA